MNATLFKNISAISLPATVMDAIHNMCSCIGYDSNVQPTYVNQYNAVAVKKNAPVVHDGLANYQRQQARKASAAAKKDDWKKPAFTVTKFSALDSSQSLLGDIRSDTNKITDKNWESKMEVIFKHIDELNEICEVDGSDFDEVLQSVLEIVHKAAIINKYHAAYANVYKAIYDKYESVTADFLQNIWAKHMESFDCIVDVSESDYDAFCNFNNANTYRKHTTQLFCEIAKLGFINEYNTAFITDAANTLLNQVVAKIDHKDKQKEVEEITENLVIMLKYVDKTPFLETIATIAAYKSGDKPGLTSRTRFKYGDLAK